LPVRNLWSLEPSECIVAEEILDKLKDVEVFFPVHDGDIDLQSGMPIKSKKFLKFKLERINQFYEAGT